ncbi:Ubiquitin carboxyl-terminal hydrolase isozyme L3 [Geodia barretti]|uniref:Ubiquitin carboxyl-terminal hydrolase n=1 Tax=Geodia barretti TaxID=519541 RepID=A0AA35T769_GEOBA|nr:Ubiquitin carboxyl-terminal hydrolase isozyme L3 [Geodia barretti]
MAEKKGCWLPLEANPDVMNKYAAKLGMNMSYQFHDVFGLDDELLGLVPQPCVAILLLFPINQKLKKYEEQETERIHKEGQICSDEVFFIKQTIGNACGTIGMLHALGNCQEQLTFGSL